jgi:hypothetical protein
MKLAASDVDADDRPTMLMIRPRAAVAVEASVGAGMLHARARRVERVALPATAMVAPWTFGAGMARPRANHARLIGILFVMLVAAFIGAYLALHSN